MDSHAGKATFRAVTVAPDPLRRTNSSASTSSFDSATTTSSSTAFALTQNLSSVLNNPLQSAAASSAPWSLWWSSSAAAPAAGDSLPPLAPTTPIPSVSREDFLPYLSSFADAFSRFDDIVTHSSRETLTLSLVSAQGEALLACLREVPSLFFKEDFELEDGPTFHAACPFSPSADDNTALQEKLSQYLDVVEVHLVREITIRSDSFYEAQGRLQGLNGEIVEACGRIIDLKKSIRVLMGDLFGSARQVQELNATRGNLIALHQKLTIILYVSQALAALKLLVAAADCTGALDVIDDLQHLLDSDELTGLHCFRHVREQLVSSFESVNSILEAEFVRAAILDPKAVDEVILSNAKKQGVVLNGMYHEVDTEDDENLVLRDRLLPLIVCLMRTAKLPSVLRIYRETLITAMKGSIKTTVAELLPILTFRPTDPDLVTAERALDSDVGGQSLASKLRSLSSDSFVQLLAAIFKIVQTHLLRAAEVKKVIEWIIGNLPGSYVTDNVAVAAGSTNGSVTGTASEYEQENDSSSVMHSSYSLSRNSSRMTAFQGKITDGSSPSTSKNLRADILRENTEAVFAACDAAHGRWAKLLGVRAVLHPKLRLQEFLGIYNITQDFIGATEKVGGRLGYSIRGTLQSQSKAFVEHQHESRMTKIKAVLDQETWVAVDVPEEFQALVASLSSTGSSQSTIELVTADDNPEVSEPHESVSEEHNSLETSATNMETGVQPSNAQDRNVPVNEIVKPMSQTIMHGGVGYHMVNCGLILLKLLSEYVDISKYLPLLSSEVVHRVVELLKLFNTRTCQLVLGAGAMQVSGLKSITSKHLALASQIISFIFAIIPDVRRVLFLKIPDTRKLLLMSEFDRLAQDYKVHRDEIHTKLVQIMRERLLINLRKLPQIVESWNEPDDDLQPSQFAKSVTKEVTYLHRILSQSLLEIDVQAIFRQVVQIFHSHITEAFSHLELRTPQANNRLCRDVQHILACIRKLPSENFSSDAVPNYGLLDEFSTERFGTQVGK